MKVNELILELARCEDHNAEVIFVHPSEKDEENVAFRVIGQAKPDANDVQWVKEIKPDSVIFIIG